MPVHEHLRHVDHVELLLAIGLRPIREETLLHLYGQVHYDTHSIPMGSYVIEVGNYVIADTPLGTTGRWTACKTWPSEDFGPV